jgi:putative ABC transport system permease protein
MRQFRRMLGTLDMVIVQAGGPSTRGMPSLTTVPTTLKAEDAKAVATEVRHVKRVAGIQFAPDLDIKYRDKVVASSVFGAGYNWTEIRHEEVVLGDNLTAEDEASLARVVLLGAEVKANLFPDEDPIGKQLRIADIPFEIKGVLNTRGVGPGGASMDNMLLIPVTTASKRLFNRDFLTSMLIQLDDPGNSAEAVKDITALMRERHGIIPPAQDDFRVTTPEAQVGQFVEVGSTLAKILIGVAVVAMLIGGTVIMSLMLIAVSERRKEIGVRRAVGASRGDIMVQFLIEAAVISFVGGIFGVIIGVGGTVSVMLMTKLPPAVMWSAVGGATVLSVVVGLVFGLQPAWRAANVDPIQALRS